jgi:hypothetical protein
MRDRVFAKTWEAVVNAEAFYRDLAKATGSANKLVQAYTDENEHTAQSDAEIAAALDSLMQWIESGTHPSPQSVAAVCENLRGIVVTVPTSSQKAMQRSARDNEARGNKKHILQGRKQRRGTATGDTFVGDGHGANTNDRVVKFDKTGKQIATWARQGN